MLPFAAARELGGDVSDIVGLSVAPPPNKFAATKFAQQMNK